MHLQPEVCSQPFLITTLVHILSIFYAILFVYWVLSIVYVVNGSNLRCEKCMQHT